MRYWLFANNKAEGPFTEDELRDHPAFSEESLVCPEGATGGVDWGLAKNRPALSNALKNLPRRYWMLDQNRATKGPFDAKALRNVPGVTPATLVCPTGAQGADAWKPAGEIADLKSVFLPEPPQAAPAKAEGKKPAPWEDFAVAEPKPIDHDFPKPEGFLPPEKTRAKIKLKLPSLKVQASVLGAALAAAGALAAVRHFHKPVPAPNPPAEIAAPPSAPEASASTPAPATAPPMNPDLQTAVDLVKSYPLDALNRRAPTNLYQIGDVNQKRWRLVKNVNDIFRYEPFRIGWQFCQDAARKNGGSPEDLARQIRNKVQDWHGLDAVYQAVWSAEAQGDGNYRVEVRVNNSLSQLLQNAFGGDSGGIPAASGPEIHAFLANPSSKTVAPINSEAEADLGTAAGGQAAAPPAQTPAKSRSRRKTGALKSKKSSAMAANPPAAQNAEASGPLEQPAPAPADQPASAQTSPSDASSAAPTLPGHPSQSQEQPQASAATAPEAPASAPAAAPAPQPQPASTPSAQPPAHDEKPATEMSVDELENYLNRK